MVGGATGKVLPFGEARAQPAPRPPAPPPSAPKAFDAGKTMAVGIFFPESAALPFAAAGAPPHEAQPDYALHGRINALQKLLDRQYVEKNQHFQQG